ncbi:hypothetical protein [Ktedonobacter racemifer]|uniref:Uncharacterized protein n=1 Tax=Ktedonobacter racemifer DSM 44963 TaxID=485913 RepID=D6TJ58_KTERA|nr:hypothetical protein [Ktedonobacter racemifer]EFH89465.1 hypothetical protein Krac_11023 [Ktedonobacter racemifer DSM 44963]
MRGKLRDKRAISHKDSFYEDLSKRQHAAKRGARGNWLEPELEEEEDFPFDELADEAEALEEVEEAAAVKVQKSPSPHA